MAFTAKDVQELRQITSAGMMDCKHALEATDGDKEKAIDWLREKGISTAAKKAGRIASEGIVDSYIHMGGRIGVLVEVNCETDFVAKTDAFKAFVHDVALQIAAANPKYVSKEEVPADVIAKEREINRTKFLNEGKKEAIVDKIVDGSIEKFYKEVCLLEQTFVKDPEKTISQCVKEATATIGEKISVRRFVRYEMGEGLEKKNENFAEEINAQVEKAKANAKA